MIFIFSHGNPEKFIKHIFSVLVVFDCRCLLQNNHSFVLYFHSFLIDVEFDDFVNLIKTVLLELLIRQRCSQQLVYTPIVIYANFWHFKYILRADSCRFTKIAYFLQYLSVFQLFFAFYQNNFIIAFELNEEYIGLENASFLLLICLILMSIA